MILWTIWRDDSSNIWVGTNGDGLFKFSQHGQLDSHYSYTGIVSVAKAKAVLKQNQLHIRWQALDKSGKVNVYIKTSNKFSKGGQDTYALLKKAKVSAESLRIDVSYLQSPMFKIVLEAKHNTINTWVVTK